ncbi:MAG: glycogen/starch/alpha-glucan phosphorylase [Planctomycetota bacterium]
MTPSNANHAAPMAATGFFERTRTGMGAQALRQAFLDNLFYVQGRFLDVATRTDLYMAAAYTVRDRLLDRWIQTAQTYKRTGARTVCYLSAEYLLGPQLGVNLINLGILETARQATVDLGLDLHAILEEEEEPGLGNGGLGRLAACFLDSLATLQVPAIGYGIRYEFGIFDQVIEDGWQREVSDLWLRKGNPWELRRAKLRFPVGFGGRTEHRVDADGRLRVRWIPAFEIDGVAYDTPILGNGVRNTNLLRLWRSEAPHSFDFQAFNVGDYYRAVEAKIQAENVSKVLYPNDEPEAGKELRLRQQHFFVSCSLQDMIRLQLQLAGNLDRFHEKFVVQLNDTHPAIGVAELMRLLVDVHGMEWEKAWHITSNTFAFTNHTLLPEALETWPVALFERLLPRHLEIIYEINHRFLAGVRRRYPGDEDRVRRLSLIDETGGRRVRMAHLATVGSHSVNGVAELHTALLRSTVLRDFGELWPEKFHNVTNGVSPRRFVQLANPDLDALLVRIVGPGWARNMPQLAALERWADDAGFQEEWWAAKTAAKRRLARRIRERTGIVLDPGSLFDVMVKRIHEYKRQHLMVLHVVTLYERLRRDPDLGLVPRTFVLGGKAAPGYRAAKLIVKLIHAVAKTIAADPRASRLLRVVFFPDFNVKNAQPIYPAADLSEQISMAGKEASGTGNMKFAMNGALTIGTLDGANVEIREEVGPENFFTFGLTVPEVASLQAAGYRPRERYDADAELRAAIDLIHGGHFSPEDPGLFRPLTDALLQHDPFLVLADYRSYVDRQADVDAAYRDRARWSRMSILNTARMAQFSSDRAIQDYGAKIWKVRAVPVGEA